MCLQYNPRGAFSHTDTQSEIKTHDDAKRPRRKRKIKQTEAKETEYTYELPAIKCD